MSNENNTVTIVIQDEADVIAQDIMTEIKLLIGDIGISSSTLAIVIRYTMEIIEKTPLKGREQLDMAMRIIGDLIGFKLI